MTSVLKIKNKHRPFHYYDGRAYFISGTCYKGLGMFLAEYRKDIFKKVLRESVKRFDIQLYSWVILNNHYHILFTLPIVDCRIDENDPSVDGEFCYEGDKDSKYFLVEFIRKMHKDTARILNKLDNTPGRKVWYQYWDYCVRNEIDFWKHFNYILKNPLKHKLAENIEESFSYEFSSNSTWLEKFSFDGLVEGLIKYKVKDVLYDEED